MSGLPTVACKRCGAQIAWIVTRATGARMPVDATPNARGNVICQVDGDGVVRGLVRKTSDTSPRPPGVSFMPHFATCTGLAKTTRQAAAREIKPPKPTPPVASSLFDNQGEPDEP